ncbi:MAG TPA: fused MFS/spermidine synthase [Longimicrobium sp.]|nr:fused MFS/spermidine synthase [Longimicrobium sp.]
MAPEHTFDKQVVHEAPSPFGTIFVVDEGDERSLVFDHPEGNRQSTILKSDPLAVPLSYVRVATSGLAFTPGRARALVIGLGGGSFPMFLRRRQPRMRVDVVELNPVVVDVARRFFGVREDDRLRITEEDGTRFLERDGPLYDLILLDAFFAEGVAEPFKEDPTVFEHLHRRLAPRGVGMVNIALETQEVRDRMIDAFVEVFGGCALLRGASETNNVVVVGTRGGGPLPTEPIFRRRVAHLARELRFRELKRSITGFSLRGPGEPPTT